MKTILQTVAFAFVLCCAASAQTTITLNNAHSGGTVEACEGIVLSPGFQFTANAGSSLNLQINLDVCADATMPLNLSANKNYIVSYTPQVACTDVSQIANSGFKGVEVVYYDGLGRPG